MAFYAIINEKENKHMSYASDVREKLVDRAAKLLGINPEEIKDEMTLESDLALKSTQITQITTYLEDEFDVEVPFMNFRRQKTVGACVDFVADILENE